MRYLLSNLKNEGQFNKQHLLLSRDFFTGFGPIAKIIVHMFYLGNSLPLATGKREKEANTSKKKGTIYWGAIHYFLLLLGRHAKELAGQLSVVFVKRGPVGTF